MGAGKRALKPSARDGTSGVRPMAYTITISDAALRTTTLATLEAYVLGDGRPQRTNSARTKLETLGYLWGFSRKDSEGVKHFHVELMSLSISAERSPDSVTPNEQAVRLKSELMSRWAPHLTLIGDFHSHPYEDLADVRSNRGYDFSPSDEQTFLADDFLWEQADNEPVMMAMTVCRLSRVREKEASGQLRANVSTFDVGEFRFWLNAAVGFLSEGNARSWSGNRNSNLQLRLDARFYNYSRDRLVGP
jgi:hypothetical protein